MSEPRARTKRLTLRRPTLAETVGLLAVLIAGLGYWDTHRGRTQEERERAAHAEALKAEARMEALKRTFLLTATPQGSGEWLRLAPVHAEQVIQTQTLVFPTEVRADLVETTGNPRIEQGWFAAGLDKAEKARGRGSEEIQGRLPVAITTVFIEDGQTRTDRAVYRMGYALHPRILRGARISLEGLSLVQTGGGDLRAAVDDLWLRQAPPAESAPKAPSPGP